MSKLTMIMDPELGKIISDSKSATCFLDPVPSTLFKNCFNCVFNSVRDIIDTSLETDIFPDAFKTAAVKPLLKKPNLDSEG